MLVDILYFVAILVEFDERNNDIFQSVSFSHLGAARKMLVSENKRSRFNQTIKLNETESK